VLTRRDSFTVQSYNDWPVGWGRKILDLDT
jgi:hypothetical protein